eukprot:TRINITY_DN8455_c0_g1_i11.p1 TRINITY_DN8455_c0_g1~~TRINITY_DN8455_c0_g1_i11.p1  ORF type:complete len:702 (-),score=91.71 TRINITY_DN8455_c0_g1_i11:519-2624(-)
MQESAFKNNGEMPAARNKNRKLTRQNASRIATDQVAELLTGITEDDVEEHKTRCGQFWAWLKMVMSCFFPEAIKNQVPQYIQLLGGGLVCVGLIVLFIWLFIYFGQCTQQTLVQKELPDDFIRCEQRRLTQQSTLGLDIFGNWSNNDNYNLSFGGPWQVEFQTYQANQTVFDANMEPLISGTRNLTNELQDKTFVEILGKIFFHQEEVQGTYGTAVISSNINIEAVFDNYVMRDYFGMIDLKDSLIENFDATNIARFDPGDVLPSLDDLAACQGAMSRNESASGITPGWNCFNANKPPKQTFNNQIPRLILKSYPQYFFDIFREHFYQNPKLNGFTKREPLPSEPDAAAYDDPEYYYGSDNAQFYYYYGSEEDYTNGDYWYEGQVVYPFLYYREIQWNLLDAFVFDYCNNVGKQQCIDLLNKQDYNKEDLVSPIGGFTGALRSSSMALSRQIFQSGIADREVFINPLQQFALKITTLNVPTLIDFENKTKGQTYTDFDLIAVPQIFSYVQKDGVNNICASCTNANISVQEQCQRQMYLVLHIYTIPVDDENVRNANIWDYYVTSLVHGALAQNQLKKLQLEVDENLNTQYFYNLDSARVNNLHCNTQEWMFKDDLNQPTPFTLTTGVFSCLVEECPTVLERLGNTQANVEMAYLGVVLLFITIFVLVLLPYARSRDENKRKDVASKLREAFEAIGDEVYGR